MARGNAVTALILEQNQPGNDLPRQRAPQRLAGRKPGQTKVDHATVMRLTSSHPVHLMKMIAWMGMAPTFIMIEFGTQFGNQIVDRPAARELSGVDVALDQRHAISFMIVINLDGHGQIR